MENIGKRIEALRLARGWSQGQTATALDIAQPSLSAIESGATASLKGKTVAMLCKVFHTTAEYIYFGMNPADDPELPLMEAEMLYMLRAMSHAHRVMAIDSVRGMFNGEAMHKNNPFPGLEPGDSQSGDLEPATARSIRRFGIAPKKAPVRRR